MSDENILASKLQSKLDKVSSTKEVDLAVKNSDRVATSRQIPYKEKSWDTRSSSSQNQLQETISNSGKEFSMGSNNPLLKGITLPKRVSRHMTLATLRSYGVSNFIVLPQVQEQLNTLKISEEELKNLLDEADLSGKIQIKKETPFDGGAESELLVTLPKKSIHLTIKGLFTTGDTEWIEMQIIALQPLFTSVSKSSAEQTNFLPDRLVMLDGEFTGVDETKYEPLQFAFLKLELQNGQYVEVGEPHVFYLQTDAQPSCDFHHKYLSHIFKKCNESTLQPYQAAEDLHKWLGDWVGEVTPTGDCVHTDLAFLKHNGIIKRNDIVEERQVPGTFHYEAFDLNPLKAFARTRKGEKYTVADLDEEHIHDALVDCRNQTKELNSYVEILLGDKFKTKDPVESFMQNNPLLAATHMTPQEVHDLFHEQKQVPDKPLSRFEEYEWKRAFEFPLDQVTVNGGSSIYQPMWSESEDEPSEMWNLSVYEDLLTKEDRSEADLEYLKNWKDEWQSEQYAKLTTQAPPVFLVWDDEQNRFRFWNGRHRARAACLRGESTIDAYVGQPLSEVNASPTLAAVDTVEIEDFQAVIPEIKEEGLHHPAEESVMLREWVEHSNPERSVPPELVATARDTDGVLVGWVGVGLFKRISTQRNHIPEDWKGFLQAFIEPSERGAGVAQKLSLLVLEEFRKNHPEVEDVMFSKSFPAAEDLIDRSGLFAEPFSTSARQRVLEARVNKRRIKSAEDISPDQLPPAVQPAEGDDGSLPLEKKEIVESFNRRSLRADSFQDFQELLNEIMLAAELVEEFRPSVAGILNEYRVAEGYVAL